MGFKMCGWKKKWQTALCVIKGPLKIPDKVRERMWKTGVWEPIRQ